jgi:hypothetical protein
MIFDLGSPQSTAVVTCSPFDRSVSAVVPTRASAVARRGSSAPSFSPQYAAISGKGVPMRSTTWRTRTSDSPGLAWAITACVTASENLEPSMASRIFNIALYVWSANVEQITSRLRASQEHLRTRVRSRRKISWNCAGTSIFLPRANI